MIKRFLLSFAVLPCLLLAAPVLASADTSGTGSGMAITIPSSVNVIARVAADVSVSITCNPFDSTNLYGYPQNGSVAVTLSQPSGQTVNSASGYLVQALTCDGTAHSYDVPVYFTKLFHGGAAALTATGFQSGYDLQQFCYPWGCYQQYVYVQEQATVLGAVQLQ